MVLLHARSQNVSDTTIYFTKYTTKIIPFNFPEKSTWWQAARTISLFPSIACCLKTPLAFGSLNIWTFVLFMYTI